MKPIEFAPRDGTKIVLFLRSGGADTAKWDGTRWITSRLTSYGDAQLVGWIDYPETPSPSLRIGERLTAVRFPDGSFGIMCTELSGKSAKIAISKEEAAELSAWLSQSE